MANNSVGAVNSSAAFLTVQCKTTFTLLRKPNCVLVMVYHAARFSFEYLPIQQQKKNTKNSLVVDILYKVKSKFNITLPSKKRA